MILNKPWPDETGHDACPTLRCGSCNGVGNLQPIGRVLPPDSIEPGMLAPAIVCPRCNGSGLDPTCTKSEIRQGYRNN